MYALLGLVFAIMATAKPQPPSSVETRPIQEIYQSALKENWTLRVSWGGDGTFHSIDISFNDAKRGPTSVRASGNQVSNAFQKSFPGIKIDVQCDLSKYLDGRINRIHETSNGTDDGADVAVLQTLHDFPRWKTQNRLLNYKPANWDDIYPEFVDPDGAYAGYFMRTSPFPFLLIEFY